MPHVPAHPFEAHGAPCQIGIEGLHEVIIEDRLAIGLAPPPLLPAVAPLGQGVDDVLRVRLDQQVLTGTGGGAQKLEDGGELTAVIRRLRPAARRPAVLVHIPGPTGGSGIPERGAVRGGDDRHARHPTGHATGASPATGRRAVRTSPREPSMSKSGTNAAIAPQDAARNRIIPTVACALSDAAAPFVPFWDTPSPPDRAEGPSGRRSAFQWRSPPGSCP